MMKLIASIVANCLSFLMKSMGIAVLPYSGNWNGLGNRIKGICNFYSRGYRRFILIWSDDNCVSDKFSSLFTLDGCKVLELNPGNKCYGICRMLFRRFCPRGVVRENYPYWSFILPDHLKDSTMKKRWGFSDNLSYSVDWWFNKTPDKVVSYFKEYFASLKPSPAVLKRISKVDFDIRDCVCVQIRNNHNPDDKKDVCSLESIMRKMQDYPVDTRFFISYMDETIWHMIVERFTGRVCRLEDKRDSSMIDTVADMWLLGHGKSMIASPESTFSEVAWWWDGGRKPVEMLKSEFNQGSIRI